MIANLIGKPTLSIFLQEEFSKVEILIMHRVFHVSVIVSWWRERNLGNTSAFLIYQSSQKLAEEPLGSYSIFVPENRL